MKSKRITKIALFTAAALMLNLIESMLPPFMPYAPGAKIGLSNLITLVALVLLGAGDAYLILLLRCFLGSVFAGNVTSLMYSLPAGVISLAIQLLLYRFLFKIISIPCISLLGAIAHNAVQVAVASIIVKVNLSVMLAPMLVASIIAGIAVGIAAFLIIKYLPKKLFTDYVKTQENK